MLIAPLRNLSEIFRQALRQGEPVIFPTDTIYGIGAPLSDKKANEKIFEIKGRDRTKPFPVLISSFSQAEELAHFDEHQKKIMDFLWSKGSFTIILKAGKGVEGLYTLDGNIALRVPFMPVLRQIIDETGAISATSANLSGVEYCGDFKTILNTFKDLVHYYSFQDITGQNSSVIIDLTHPKPILIRGVFDIETLSRI
ncbi:L-threonylcarbamoyladenylate synthase [Seleniivibrio woodruffii]|uniref:L-threonylcarbamoyladenylate synthase n=1 Tax=Seleniivibrio woodruffii TaxID=1078050 RepID=UPI002409CC92|nr:L-threonylcarbamoyladenylate synthase [Seleniivibrio woodruffii]